MTYYKGLGEAIAEGAATASNNFVSTTNTLQQQQQQQANLDRQFKYQRDSDAYNRLYQRRQELTAVLGQGGLKVGTLEHGRAVEALRNGDKLLSKIQRGEELTPEEVQKYDALFSDVAELTGIGLGNVGSDVAQGRANTLQGQVLQNEGQGIANATGTVNLDTLRQTQPFTVSRARSEASLVGDQALVSSLTRDSKAAAENATNTATTQLAPLQVQSAQLGVDLQRFNLEDLQTKAPLVYEGMRLSNDAAQQTLDFNAEANPERLQQFKLQNQQLIQTIEQSGELFPWQKAGLIADVRAREAQADIVQATKQGLITRQNAESFAALAQSVRDPAAFDQLVKEGVLSAEQAAPFKALAGYYKDAAGAELQRTIATARSATSQANVDEATEPFRISILEDQAGITSAQRQEADALLQTRVDLFQSDADLRMKTNAVEEDLLALKEEGARAAYLDGIARTGAGGAAIIDGLVGRGVITKQQASGYKKTAANVQTTGDNTAALSGVQVESARFDLDSAKQLFPVQLGTARAQLDAINFQLEQARKKAPFDLRLLQGQVRALEQEIEQNAQLFGPKLEQARAVVRQLQSEVRVLEGTEGARIEAPQLANDAARFELQSAKQLFPVQLGTARAQLDTINFQLQLARERKPFDLALLKGQVDALEQEIEQNAQLFGPRLDQARLTVRQLRSEVGVLERTADARVTAANANASTAQSQAASAASQARVDARTEDARVGTANATARGASAQATSAEAQAQVDVATIPAQIATRNLAPQQAQAALDAQLLENRFSDATFAARVKAIDLNNDTGFQQLLTLRQTYQQNAKKFPKELEYLNAQVAVTKAQAVKLAAESVTSDGTVTDKKTMLEALKRMQIGHADELRTARANYKTVVDKLFGNARFSVDKYDPKNFSTLTTQRKDLTPEQLQELQTAKTFLDAAVDKNRDLITAIGQVGSKGRIDPKIAESLGMTPDPEPSSTPSGRVFRGGGASAPASGLPQSELLKQIVMMFDHPDHGWLTKVKATQGRDTFADNGPLRAYNGFGRKDDGSWMNPGYVEDIQATYNRKPWLEAINDATGTRKQELIQINALIEQEAKKRKVDPDVIKAIAWHESMGWQPGIPSSDGKGGGLGQTTGYFPPTTATYSQSGPNTARALPNNQQGPPAPSRAPASSTVQASSTTPPSSGSVNPQTGARTVTLSAQQLTGLKPFFTQVQNAPSAAAAQKLLQDKAIALAGGPNAPQDLKKAYFDALLAAAKGGR